ncbi:rhamnulokinase [candidate division KSB1 bacterium]|nr:rhamnulokinase [candidate division KSB1 bacterium]
MAQAKFLAIDLGASSGRGVVGTLTDRKLTMTEIARFPNAPITIMNHLHWNIYSLYEQLINAMGICAQNHTRQLQGIGIDTWGVDFGFVGRNDSLVGIPYAYRDHRTDNIMEKAFERLPRQTLYQLTGIQFMQFNSIFQLYAMVLENSPILEAADKILFIPDLLGFLFCGEKKTESSITSTSQLINPFSKKWERQIFENLSIPLEKMPEIIPTGSRLGSLLPEIKKQTGLEHAPLIATANHDTAAAVAAVPAKGDDWAYLSSGTWSLMGVEIADPIINDQSLAFNFTNEGGFGGTIRFLKNIMGLWLVQECRRIWANQGDEYDYGTLTQMAADANSFRAFIDPDDASFLHPEDMPRAICQFCEDTGQPCPETHSEMIRIILESLALKYRMTLENLNQLRGKSLKVLHIVGGGTKNELLCQLAASACGIPVIAGPVEATAIGNILVQAVATGELDSIEDAREVIRQSFEVKTYKPQNQDRWDEAYHRFKAVLNQ